MLAGLSVAVFCLLGSCVRVMGADLLLLTTVGARNPDKVWVEVGKSLAGAERAEAWRRIAAQSPGYDAYQQKTDRQIWSSA